ncbi:MAG: hypothetical protein JRH00_07810 [Deltaproteobacteria bacterium]|nr:hypothetical protein [Deltaproteobacteria bacterium]
MTKGFITPPRFGLAVVVLLLFLVTGSPKAETQALEQLIELLEANKAISPQQAATLRAAIARDRQRMEERERSLREAERAVSRREMELRQREEALAHKGVPARVSVRKGYPPPLLRPPHQKSGRLRKRGA